MASPGSGRLGKQRWFAREMRLSPLFSLKWSAEGRRPLLKHNADGKLAAVMLRSISQIGHDDFGGLNVCFHIVRLEDHVRVVIRQMPRFLERYEAYGESLDFRRDLVSLEGILLRAGMPCFRRFSDFLALAQLGADGLASRLGQIVFQGAKHQAPLLGFARFAAADEKVRAFRSQLMEKRIVNRADGAFQTSLARIGLGRNEPFGDADEVTHQRRPAGVHSSIKRCRR
jgi:hypothetical protein